MKNITFTSAMLLIAALSIQSCSTYSSCDRFRMGISSRGADDPFTPGSGKEITKSKADAQCVVTVYNRTDQKLDIFIDTVWQGSLNSKTKGFVNIEDGKFNYMHAITNDGEYGWSSKGDCSGKKDFKISKK